MQVRRAATYILIDKMLEQYRRVRRDPDVRAFLATFAWNAGLTPITAPEIDLEAMERSVRRQLNRLGLNAVCAFDIDVFSRPFDGEQTRYLHFHVHALCWTRDPKFQPRNSAEKLCSSRAFPNRIGVPSVTFRSRAESAAQFAGFQRALPNQDQTAASMAMLAQYILKDTCVSKNRYRGRDGRMRTRPEAGRFTPTVALRFAEIYSQISPYDAVFAVGPEASMITAAYGARLRRWERRNREHGEQCDEHRLMAAWARYFDLHPELEFAPSSIHQRRHTLAASSTC
ncbi:hypothetical protein GCM10009095_03180 [Sphingomonas molluscorum]|nr:hypothetical protein CA235_15000 [Sphingomonas sp. ABOLF]GLK20536.1 hypothetical protein GCM10017606_13620 [Microbacterium terregens]